MCSLRALRFCSVRHCSEHRVSVVASARGTRARSQWPRGSAPGNPLSCPHDAARYIVRMAFLRASPAQALAIVNAQSSVLDVSQVPPSAAVRMLKESLGSVAERAQWRQCARLAAIMGACPKSRQGLAAGKLVTTGCRIVFSFTLLVC